MNCPSFLPGQRDFQVDARREIDVAGHVPRLARLEDEHRRDRPPAEQVADNAARFRPGNSYTPDAVMRCLRCEKYGPMVLQERDSSTYALPMPVVVLAPSSVQRGTQV